MDRTVFVLSKGTPFAALMLVWSTGLRFWLGFSRLDADVGRSRRLTGTIYLVPVAIYAMVVLRPGAASLLELLGRMDQAAIAVAAS
jgi:hypothetical protein